MEWRGPAWFIFVIVAFVVLLAELITETQPSFIVFTAVGFVFAAVIFQKTDRHVTGIARHARHHFGLGWHKLTEVTKPIPEREWFNIDQAMLALNHEQGRPNPLGVQKVGNVYADDDVDEFGAPRFPQPFVISLADLIRTNARQESLQYRTLTSNAPRPLRIAINSMFLLRTDGETKQPFAVSLQHGRLAVAAKTELAAQQAIQLIELKSQQISVYRGHVLACKTQSKRKFRIEFLGTPDVAREQLILPEQILEVLDRNVLQVIQHASELGRSWRNLQHGVLLYGPPGTGKTLAIRYLMTAAKPVTVVKVTGRQLQLVRESIRLARLLAPSIVVLEDIDLIATDRAQSRRTMLLHDLLDEMDASSTELPVVFLMTTNRPDVIEQALSLRPGRVNQAIHFPLPDDDCRLRLLQHFLKGIESSEVDLPAMVARSRGTSAAFIEEWVRRAALFSVNRQSAGAKQTSINMQDVDAAIHEIVELGGNLTRKLLGHASVS